MLLFPMESFHDPNKTKDSNCVPPKCKLDALLLIFHTVIRFYLDLECSCSCLFVRLFVHSLRKKRPLTILHHKDISRHRVIKTK